MKNLPKVTPVQTAGRSDIFHGDIILKILLNKSECLLYVEIPQAVPLT